MQGIFGNSSQTQLVIVGEFGHTQSAQIHGIFGNQSQSQLAQIPGKNGTISQTSLYHCLPHLGAMSKIWSHASSLAFPPSILL